MFTLHDKNSTAIIDTGSQAGMFHWDILGQNQLAQQWFWFRVGNNPEQPINAISAPVNSTFLGTRGLSSIYANPGFSIEIDYLLTGGSIPPPIGGIAQADIAEQISIRNTSAAPLDFHFFQYSDFDLGGPGNDIVQLGTDPSGNFNSAVQTDGISTLTESVSVTAPSASHGEVNFFNTTLAKLNDGNPDVLNDNAGPAGPGDVTWALEWDLSLAPDQTFIISKDKALSTALIPEPSSMILFPIGTFAFGFYSRRQRS